MLYYSLSSARIFFRADKTAAEERDDSKEQQQGELLQEVFASFADVCISSVCVCFDLLSPRALGINYVVNGVQYLCRAEEGHGAFYESLACYVTSVFLPFGAVCSLKE